MKEIIFRISDYKQDAEVLVCDGNNKREYFKSISFNNLLTKLDGLIPHETSYDPFADMVIANDDLIGVSPTCIIAKQPEHKRIVTYAGKAYKINFPNSIYMIRHHAGKIANIKAFCYKEYCGMNTKLFKYAMPNMLGEGSICLGTAPKDIDVSNYTEAIERVIFTQYTHARPDNIKKFETTSEYFKYLCDHDFPYDLLYPYGTLKEVFKK